MEFENRRNNIYLIPLLDGRSFNSWSTFLKVFEIPASILISSNCLSLRIKTGGCDKRLQFASFLKFI